MRSAAASPDTPLAALTMVLPAEVEQVVGTFNQTERALPAPFDGCTIHGMFEHWADQMPSAPALAFEVRSWPLVLCGVEVVETGRDTEHPSSTQNM